MADELYTFDEDGVRVPVRSVIQHSEQVDKILPALLEAQKAIDHVGRDATAQVKTKGDKPDYSYGYTTLAHTLDAIKGPLNKNDVVVIQGVQSEEFEYTHYDKVMLGMRVTVATGLYHVSGQWFETELMMVARDTTPQTVGSCVTYGRRYTAMPLNCLASTDDDGAAASLPLAPPKPRKSGTKKQGKKETDEAEAKLAAEAAFNAAWDKVMESVGEDDAENVKALRCKFFKTTTEKSTAFLAMTDSTAGMNAKEVKLITAMLTKGDGLAKVAGLCADKWRKELGLVSLGVEACEVCNAVLTDAEKTSCAIAKLPGHWCTKHVAEGVKKAQKMKEADNAG
jgi:hypothetical protein